MNPPRFRRSVSAAITASCFLAAAAFADDTLKLKDGRAFSGRVISENAGFVLFETHSRSIRMTARYPRAEVAAIVRDAASGPTFYALPIIGTIGKQAAAPGAFVSAETFKAALDEVRNAKPDFVVLVIDSPGGALDQMQEIIEAIGDARDLRFVAYVKRAISAAAIIALRCPAICMAPNATIGGAVPFKIGPDGTPQNIEEKFQSILRAEFRRAAELGGHSPLIAQAMMDTDLELQLTRRAGAPAVVEAAPGASGNIFKHKGRILTLTADEAQSCGVSLGTADGYSSVASLLGLQQWRRLDDKAWYEMINAADAEVVRDHKRRVRDALLNEYTAEQLKLRRETVELGRRIEDAQKRRDAAIAHAQELTNKQKAELDELKAQWDAERVTIAGSSTNNAALTAMTRRRLADLDVQFAPRRQENLERNDQDIQDAVKKAKAADEEARTLYQQWTQLRDKISDKPKQ